MSVTSFFSSFFKSHESFVKNLMFFSVIFLMVFLVSISILSYVGFIPNEFNTKTEENTIAQTFQNDTLESLGLAAVPEVVQPAQVITSDKGEQPLRIVATSIGLDTTVERPRSVNYTVLDNALMRGPVYYPGSGTPGHGNVFIFGHSTSFKLVNNKAYQVFNDIKNLTEGAEIDIYGDKKVYTYKIKKVNLVNENKALVDFSEANTLTLSTCNSFGQKTDRYVAVAMLVSSRTQ